MLLFLLTLNTKIRLVFRLTPTVCIYFLFEHIIVNHKRKQITIYRKQFLTLLLIVLKVKWFKIVFNRFDDFKSQLIINLVAYKLKYFKFELEFVVCFCGQRGDAYGGAGRFEVARVTRQEITKAYSVYFRTLCLFPQRAERVTPVYKIFPVHRESFNAYKMSLLDLLLASQICRPQKPRGLFLYEFGYFMYENQLLNLCLYLNIKRKMCIYI